MTLDRLTTQLFITILGAVAVEPVGFMKGDRHMKVYIAGAITDNPNYREQFKEAEERLVAAGHAVINPCKNEGFTYREYINMGLCELMHCDAIYLLKGYETSTGATLEHDYARTVGLEIMQEPDQIVRAEFNDLIRYLDIAEQLGCKTELSPERVKQLRKLAKKEQPRAVIVDYGATLCPHCGNDVDEYSEYCSYCGQHLR